MLPFPIYYRLVDNCSTEEAGPPGNETWPTCPQLRSQACTFLLFSAAILCLSVASRFAARNRHTEPAVASMVGAVLVAETVIAACLLCDSLAFLGLDLCRDFPRVSVGSIASLLLGLNQWVAGVCLFYRNWLVALISLTRYRLFNRQGGGGSGGRGAGDRERRSLRQFRLASFLLVVNAAAFCTFLSLKTVGLVCAERPWGSVEVDRFLLAVNNATLFLAVNTAVVFPLQVVLPLVIGLVSSFAVLVTLWRHMGGSLRPAAQSRRRYRRPFVAFLAMNVALLLLYLPTVLIRILVLLNYDLNHLFWVSNLLCCTNSLTNMFVYFYLCKACGDQRQQLQQQQHQQMRQLQLQEDQQKSRLMGPSDSHVPDSVSAM